MVSTQLLSSSYPSDLRFTCLTEVGLKLPTQPAPSGLTVSISTMPPPRPCVIRLIVFLRMPNAISSPASPAQSTVVYCVFSANISQVVTTVCRIPLCQNVNDKNIMNYIQTNVVLRQSFFLSLRCRVHKQTVNCECMPKEVYTKSITEYGQLKVVFNKSAVYEFMTSEVVFLRTYNGIYKYCTVRLKRIISKPVNYI